MSEITSRIFIEARVKTTGGEAMVRIRDAHTNIVRIEANGEVLLEKEEASVEGGHEEKPLIHNYTLKQIYEYAKEVPAEEIEFNKAEGKGVLNIHSAEADFSDAIRLNSNNAYIYYNRGNLHAGRNELSKAIDDYTIALRIDNRLAEAYYNRGIARAKSGNKQTAIQDLSKAGELGLYDAYSVIKRLNKSK